MSKKKVAVGRRNQWPSSREKRGRRVVFPSHSLLYMVRTNALLQFALVVALLALWTKLWRKPDDSPDVLMTHGEFDILVVGSGSAGLTTAWTAAKHGARVLVVEKTERVGGNSAKASSGISAAVDFSDRSAFKRDLVASSGGLGNPALIDALVDNSEDAIEFLRRDIGVTLDEERVRMGGHSSARTLTFRNGAVGVELVRKLKEAVDKEPNIVVRTNARVTALLKERGRVVGCEVAEAGTDDSETTTHRARRAVVLATGGFGHNFRMVERYLQNRTALCTTNGPFATGDGLELGEGVGANAVQLEHIQVHPTGFVDPKQPNAPTKILAPEKLRGLGGVLVDQGGRRFVNELGTRKEVSNAINLLEGREARLVIDRDIAAKVGPAMNFYVSKGLFQPFVAGQGGQGELLKESVAGLDMGSLMVARVTPAVHYTMGGLEFDTFAAALDERGERVSGLFIVGEVGGGLHGANRLGGCSLLECIVFGRIAGRSSVNVVD